MKTKIGFLILIIVSCMLVFAGCGNATNTQAQAQDIGNNNGNSGNSGNSGNNSGNRPAMKIGKIISIDQNKVTIQLADTQGLMQNRVSGTGVSGTGVNRPRRSPGATFDPNRTRDPSRTMNPNRSPGQGFGGNLQNLKYTDQKDTYTVSDQTQITSFNRGNNNDPKATPQSLNIKDLKPNMVISFQTDNQSGNSTQLTRIRIMG